MNKKFRTFSNEWKLSIFTIIPPNISPKSISILKYLENENISFIEYLNSLNLDESTYILNLKSK
jgi:hypothetical protein